MSIVEHLMSKKVVSMEKTDSLKKLVKMMATSKISCIVVTTQGRPTGLVTERDLIKVLHSGKKIEKAKVGDVGSKKLFTIEPETDVGAASLLMQDNKIRHLPVVKEGILVGILSQTDLIKETHDLHTENVKFTYWQNIQSAIIIAFFIIMAILLLYKFIVG